MAIEVDTHATKDNSQSTSLLRSSLLGVALLAIFLAWPATMAGQDAGDTGAASAAGSKMGQWTAPVDVGVMGINAALLHTGKVLYWQYPSSTPESPAILYDPNTGNVKQVTAPFARDIFCSGNSILADGRVLVAGGSNDSCHNPNGCGIRASELFDPITETWSDNAEMSFSRYYPSNVLLPDGTSITLSGNNATGTALIKPIESWDPLTGAWTRLPGSANIPATFDLYPRLVVLPSGKLFNAGPQPDTWTFDTSSKTWSFLANMNASYRSGEGMVLLPGLEKVLVTGGQASGAGLRTAEIIDLSTANPKWVYTSSMSYGRHDVNMVLLPNGTALAVGGAQGAGSYSNPAKHAELYDPATGRWTVMAAQKAQRGYHSTALLLPDARVISAGSDSGPLATTIEIYNPPYLFKGPRPVISSARDSVAYRQNFSITTPDSSSIAKVVLIRADVTTHANHFEQRYVGLAFRAGSDELTASAPASSTEAPPGYYMLFIVNSSGIPSVAKFLHVTP